MERIICDRYQKIEKPLFGDDLNAEFNQKIVAVNTMYGWLYEQGLLEKVSFEFKDYSSATYFAFDAQDLLPYREAMESSGIDGAKLAASHIFDVEYSPCIYSGSIELSWTMFSYRSFDGTVSRSWENELCRHLNSSAVLDVAAAREAKGVKAAVQLSFELSGFKKTDMITVRELTEEDASHAAVLDELSGQELVECLDCEGYVWGVFYGDHLAGYCSIGGAEDYEGFRGWNHDALVLCDVYVSEKYRGKGLASELIETVISENTNHGEKLYITILDDHLAEFYEKFGFKMIDEDAGVMLHTGRARGRGSLAKKILSATLKRDKPSPDKESKAIEPERD